MAWALGSKRRLTALLAFVALQLHLLCDLAGSDGSDGCPTNRGIPSATG